MIVKVCGLTRLEDALAAARMGANAVGFVLWPHSPRYIEPPRAAAIAAALPPDVASVGVFVNQPLDEVARTAAEVGVGVIQLHGDESPEYAAAVGRPVWRAMSLAAVPGAIERWDEDTTILLDAHDPARRGGTGIRVDWTGAARLARTRRIVLAGGLTPENIEEAIATVQPFGVDVSSGVESAPGVKDLDKMARFLERARAGLHAQ